MKIGIIGIGKLGLCFGLNLKKAGHQVYGVDKDIEYVEKLKLGTFNITEDYVNEYLIKYGFNYSTYIEDALNCDVIFVDTKASGLSSLNDTSNKTTTEKIKLKVFDNLYNIDKDLIGLVKIDFEGHEVNVLNGMKNLLKSSSPMCLIEFQGSKRHEIIDLLTSFYYDKFYIVQKTGFYNNLHSRGFLLIRFVKLILGLFLSPKFKIKEVSVKELLKIETEMLICSSSFSKVKLSL